MSEPIHVSLDFFAAEVESFPGTVLIDFWAEWCMPCRMMAPIFEDLAKSRDDAKFCKVNVDENPDLAMKFGIDAIPAIVAVKGGRYLDKSVGYTDRDKLESFLEENL